MRWILLVVQIVSETIPKGFRNDEEMVRLRNSSITPLTVPPSLSITINDGPRLRRDRDVGTANRDHIVVCFSKAEGCLTGKRNCGTGFQLREVQSLVSGYIDVVERDGRA